jgi:hypothetical protein
VAVEIVERGFQGEDAAAEMAGADLLVRVGRSKPSCGNGRRPSQPACRSGAAGRSGGTRGWRARIFPVWRVRSRSARARPRFTSRKVSTPAATSRSMPVGGFRAGLRRRDLDAARGDDDQPAGGGFGRAQQAQDHPPDPARHLIRAALVQPGIGEQHRDDAQKRRAVAGDGCPGQSNVCPCVRSSGKGKAGGGRWTSFRIECRTAGVAAFMGIVCATDPFGAFSACTEAVLSRRASFDSLSVLNFQNLQT